MNSNFHKRTLILESGCAGLEDEVVLASVFQKPSGKPLIRPGINFRRYSQHIKELKWNRVKRARLARLEKKVEYIRIHHTQ